jgi:hypothetical protein
MARKYEYVPGRYASSLEKCEEEILIAGYDEVSRFIPPDQTWKLDFENHFFDHGNGFALEFLDHINATRRRRGLDQIEIKETDIYDYARSPDKLMKSNHRRRIREELKEASIDVCVERVARASAEAERLPRPHFTYEEHKSRKLQLNAATSLSRDEVAKRALAWRTADTPRVVPAKPVLAVEKAAKALELATRESLRGEIISMVSPENALEVAERVTAAAPVFWTVR